MVKLSDAELKVMEVLWKHGEVPANIVTKTLKDEIIRRIHCENSHPTK